MHFILFILIGLIAGALAGRVVSGHGYGVVGDIVVGVLGAFLASRFSPFRLVRECSRRIPPRFGLTPRKELANERERGKGSVRGWSHVPFRSMPVQHADLKRGTGCPGSLECGLHVQLAWQFQPAW